MKLENQVVSLELAKKLKSLGFEQESLWYWQEGTHYTTYVCNIVSSGISNSNKKAWCGNREDYSAYTVAELGILAKDYIHKSWGSENKWKCSCITEHKRDEENIDSEETFFYANTEANARATMLIYLKENNLIR